MNFFSHEWRSTAAAGSGAARECECECTRGYDERIRPAVHIIRNAIVVLRRRGRYVVSAILPPIFPCPEGIIDGGIDSRPLRGSTEVLSKINGSDYLFIVGVDRSMRCLDADRAFELLGRNARRFR